MVSEFIIWNYRNVLSMQFCFAFALYTYVCGFDQMNFFFFIIAYEEINAISNPAYEANDNPDYVM